MPRRPFLLVFCSVLLLTPALRAEMPPAATPESVGLSSERLQRMDQLLAMIHEGSSLEFMELFASLQTKAEMIVTFLALLELVRLKRVRVYQRGMFGGIRVFRPVGPPAETPPVPAPSA